MFQMCCSSNVRHFVSYILDVRYYSDLRVRMGGVVIQDSAAGYTGEETGGGVNT